MDEIPPPQKKTKIKKCITKCKNCDFCLLKRFFNYNLFVGLLSPRNYISKINIYKMHDFDAFPKMDSEICIFPIQKRMNQDNFIFWCQNHYPS